jgi:hypothetical protein
MKKNPRPLVKTTPNEGTIKQGNKTDRRSGTAGQKRGKISDEVGHRRRVLVKKKNLFIFQ